MKAVFWRLIFAASLLILMIYAQSSQATPLHAQENHLIQIPVDTPNILQWTPDSRCLLIYATPFSSGSLGWYLYDIEQHTLSPSSDPFTPKLTAREAVVFAPTAPDGTLNDTEKKAIIVSPNGRYLIYAGRKHKVIYLADGGNYEQWAWHLMLGDRNKLQVIETSVDLYYAAKPDLSDIIWSQDGSTFIVDQSASGIQNGHRYFVTGYANDLSHYRIQEEFEKPVVEGKTYTTGDYNVLDLSPDGRYVLMSASEQVVTANQPSKGLLILYDAHDHSKSRLIPISSEDVSTAQLLHNNPNQVLLATTTGLILWNISGQSGTVLNSSLDSKHAPWITFSPNEQWITIVDEAGRLYIIRLEYVDLVGALKPTVTPLPTSLN